MQNTQPINPQVLELLKNNRTIAEWHYERFVQMFGDMNVILSKKFYFQVVMNECAKMSKIKVNKSIKDTNYFNRELSSYCELANKACMSPMNKEYRAMRIQEIGTSMAAKLDLI